MKNLRQIVLIANDIRSTHNVGSLFRTAEGMGVHHIYLTGYTPHPWYKNDKRLPHQSDKQTRAIKKVSLGAEEFMQWSFKPDVIPLITSLKKNDYIICALEQNKNSVTLDHYKPQAKIVLVVGNEVTGVTEQILNLCDHVVEIPMLGQKESHNVTQAAAIALYYLRFYKA